MTQRYLGGIITANPTEPSSNLSTASASGMWTLQEALSFYRAGDWPDPTTTPSDVLWITPGINLNLTIPIFYNFTQSKGHILNLLLFVNI